jgi:Protein of unknown function (DUF3300)
MKDSMRRIAVCVVMISAMVLFPAGAGADPQDPPAQAATAAQPAAPAEQQTLNAQQLESMVAPIALYPDTLLSQVLVASTYPLEVVEAQQWLDQNKTLTGPKVVDAAKKENWDPSIQALVAFPDVLKRLNSDIRWTTDLGNAFLAQQADVMAAVQRLRASAKASGKLTDTPQAKVVTEDQNGQSAIEIQPTDPQVVYVPTYNPAYFWGPPVYPWPGLFYPGIGIGWGWGPGISLGFFFPGCCGWGGWGWGFGWFGGGIFVNGPFFHRYGFHDFHGGAYGRSAWAHDPGHRGGVPYPRGVAGRYGGAARGEARPNAAAVRSDFARSEARGANEARPNNHSAFGGTNNGSRAREQSDHGFSSMGSARTAPAFHGGGGGGGFRGGGGGGHAGGGRR